MRRRMLPTGAVLTAVWMVMLGVPLAAPAQASPITLTEVATGFHHPIGIDHHEPTNKLVISVNYSSGKPSNFALVGSDGSQSPFSSISGLTDELKVATVRSGPCQGGFTAGELFTGSGEPGVVVRVSPDGSSIANPWVTLPGEEGLMRGGLFQDRYCSFGGDLIVVTTAGGVWRITSAGEATRLARIGTHLEGVQALPDDPARYGPWAGTIVAGAEAQSRFYTVDAAGRVASFELGIAPEDIDVIAAGESLYGVDFGAGKIWTAGAAQWTSMVGDLLVPQEGPGILFRVHWNARTSSFETEPLVRVGKWEHVTFSPARIATTGIGLSPRVTSSRVGSPHVVTAAVVDTDDQPRAGVPVTFDVAGPNAAATRACEPASCQTGPDGHVTFSYVGRVPGTDVVTACFTNPEGTRRCTDAPVTWTQPSISIDDVTVFEGDAGTTSAIFAVSLSASAGSGSVTVEASTADGEAVAGSDYVAQHGAILRFAPGESTASFTVPVLGDRENEPEETFLIRLHNPVNASIARGRGVGTIVDDDRNGSLSCRATAVRLGGVELAVANAPADPCEDDEGGVADAVLLSRPVTVISNTLRAATDQTPDDLEATAPAAGDLGTSEVGAQRVRVRAGSLTLVATVVTATARVECVAGPNGLVPTLLGSSTIGSLTVNDLPVDVSGSASISLPLDLGSLEINRTVTAESGVTQQAIRLEVLGVEVVIGEAMAGFSGNPCAS